MTFTTTSKRSVRMFRDKFRTIVHTVGIAVAYCAVLALLMYPVLDAGRYLTS